jgi:hypothetical protein
MATSVASIAFSDATLTPQTGVCVWGNTTNATIAGAGTNVSITLTDNPVRYIQANADFANNVAQNADFKSSDNTVVFTTPAKGVINMENSQNAPGSGAPLGAYFNDVPATQLGGATAPVLNNSTPVLARWQVYPYPGSLAGGFVVAYMDLVVKWTIDTVNPPAVLSLNVLNAGRTTPEQPWVINNPGVQAQPPSVGETPSYVNGLGSFSVNLQTQPATAGQANPNALASVPTTNDDVDGYITITQSISSYLRFTNYTGSFQNQLGYISLLPTFTMAGSAVPGTIPSCSVVYNNFYPIG